MRKIGDFKNNTLKVERVPKTFENLNSFETMLKMLKTMPIYIYINIFWIYVVFRYFWIFLKIYQNIGQKLGSNKINQSSNEKLPNRHRAGDVQQNDDSAGDLVD
jgi:hypothetical protein